MGRCKSTELGRFNALCREYGVTYGQGVAMGLTLQPGENKKAVPVEPMRANRLPTRAPAKPLDCTRFSELYNRGCNNQKIAGELAVPKSSLYRWMKKLGIPGNSDKGRNRIYNAEITSEWVYEQAKAVGVPVAEPWESALQEGR